MAPSRSTIRDGLIFSMALGAVAWVFFGSGLLLVSHAENAPNREALLRLHREIPIGAPVADVRELFRRHANPRLRLHDGQGENWWIGMPMEFGGGDWTLRIGFRDLRVVYVRMRTMDGPPPPDGPPDKP